MLSIPFTEMQAQIDALEEKARVMRPKPIFFFDYLNRVLKEDWERIQPKYPQEIRICKNNKALLKGDYEPADVIVLEKPITRDGGVPIWLDNTMDGFYIRYGFENLDARRVSSVKMNMEFIHGFLGGSTGHGKSVTLNALIGTWCYEYPPWELEIHLSDAKIVEFKRYGVGPKIPHLASIAATTDPDFVISVLERAKREMEERAKIFGNLGIANLKDFRKKTGLVMPQVIIVMDEVESTFRLAGKRADVIAKLIDDFVRLGRAAGYHLYLATQNMSADIPKSAIGQIRIRTCLGANEATSMGVLGNSGATDIFGRIGRLIYNGNVLNGGDTLPGNVKFQAPFQTPENFAFELKELEECGRSVGFKRTLAFYDEEDIFDVARFDPEIDKAYRRMKGTGEANNVRTPVCLGYPAFVTEDVDGMLKVVFDGRDVENVVICCTSADRVSAHLHNISKCLHANGYAIQLFTTEKDRANWVCSPLVVQEALNAEKPPLSTIGSLVRKRLFLLTLDTLASAVRDFDREAVEAIFAQCSIPQSSWGNTRYCKRLIAYKTLHDDKEWADVQYLFPSFAELYAEFEKAHCGVKQISRDDFVKATFIVGDMAKIVGYGRDTKSKYVNILKKVMQDACRVNVLYVLFTRNMEGLNDLASGLRYAIFDSPDSRDWGRLRTEAPASLNSKLALLFDNMDSDNPHYKFKRTLLEPE